MTFLVLFLILHLYTAAEIFFLHGQSTQLSYEQLEEIYQQGWTFSLPLSNMFFSEDAYEQTIPILEKIYRPGNSVIVSTVELAKLIRRDFPNFKIKASVIANIGYNENTVLKELKEAFKYYDTVTLHQKLWNNEKILTQIKEKNRISLFADVSCAPYCENQACYHIISRKNFGGHNDFQKRKCDNRNILDMNEAKCGHKWNTINFQNTLHPMYDGIIYFKYGVRRDSAKIDLYKLLKEQGHPGY